MTLPTRPDRQPDHSKEPAVYRVGGYREYPAPPDLHHLVDGVWIHETPPVPVPPAAAHRVVAEHAVNLCYVTTRGPDGTLEAAALALFGPVRSVRFYRPAAGQCLAAVRIKLEWCRELLGLSPGDHLDAMDDFTGIDRAAGVELLCRLNDARSHRQALSILIDFVRGRAGGMQVPGGTDMVHRGLDTIRGLRGVTRLGPLSGQLGITDRHFRRLVTQTVGVEPGAFVRVQRFHGLLRESDRHARPNWAGLAAAHGYADQAHMIRDVREMCGVTPVALHRERRAEGEGVNDAVPGDR